MRNRVLVTGGAGFIGSNFVLAWLRESDSQVTNLDRLTYAGNPANLASLCDDSRHEPILGDICDAPLVAAILAERSPRAIVHFAAESHVDRSIASPSAFLRTNVEGTCVLLEQARIYWSGLSDEDRRAFRFVHISTDEVYGSLGPADPPFSECSLHAPSSPYAASKAAAADFVRAWHATWGLPVILTNCSNNYGPRQFPEKLIPLLILNALEQNSLPIYGDGLQVRDWLFVEDHCSAIRQVLANGRPGETYNIGGGGEHTNLDVATRICDLLDEMAAASGAPPRRSLIAHVADRPGHDRRYAMNIGKISRELGWRPSVTFEQGLRRTIRWYLDNPRWIESVRSGSYRTWLKQNYGDRPVI